MTAYSPWHIDIAPWAQWKSSSTYTLTRTNHSSYLGMGYLYCDAAGASGKHIEWDVGLGAGTWQLTLIYTKYTNYGILIPSIDGVDLASLDCYNSGASTNLANQWSGITVASSGIKELKFRTDTKNASSSDYDLLLQWITLMRTA